MTSKARQGAHAVGMWFCDRGKQVFPENVGKTNADKADDANSLAKWAAGGFTLLAGILTFLGVKEGVLDRMLVTFPYAAMLVFCLVGLGVIGAMASWLLPATQPVPIRVAIAAIVLLGLVAVRVVPDLPGTVEDRLLPTAGAVAALVGAVVLWLMVCDRTASARAMILLVATASLGIGLFGAAKIGVLSKGFTAGIEVIPTVTRSEGTATVTLNVTAGGLRYHNGLRVSLLDASDPVDEQLLGAVYLASDVGGALAQDVSFLVPSSVAEAVVRVTVCNAAPAGLVTPTTAATEPVKGSPGGPSVPKDDVLLCASDLGDEVYARFAITAGTAPPTAPGTSTPVLAVSVTPGAAAATATVDVTGTGLPAGSRVDITVTAAGETVAIASVQPDADGTVTWKADVSGPSGATVEATAALDGTSGATQTSTGRFTIPDAG